MRVLIVEDNRSIAESIGEYLSLYDHVVEYAFNGEMALSILQHNEYDVMVLDIMLPKVNGLECLTSIRNSGNGIPVIVLSACDTVPDRIKGFDKGADDYLVKPFSMDELYVRLQALVARGARKDIGEVIVGKLKLALSSDTAYIEDESIKLNRLQFKLLKELAMKSPAVVTKSSLEYVLWGDEPPPSDALRTHVYRLRGILTSHPGSPQIETVHGKGFKLAPAQTI